MTMWCVAFGMFALGIGLERGIPGPEALPFWAWLMIGVVYIAIGICFAALRA